jgi:hypothetical protein
MENGQYVHRLIVFCWPRGEGKCQGKGSRILMFDGSTKKVEDVVVGDLLMGDDNTPRKVLSLASGKEEMYEVVPKRGEPMVVTADHVLSLKRRRSRFHKRGKPFEDPKAGEIVDISLQDYQKQNQWFKDLHLLYRVPIEWEEQTVDIDPYLLGLWLGDGSSNTSAITNMDEEVVDYLYAFADKAGMRIAVYRRKPGDKASLYRIVTDNRGKKNGNNLLNALREYDLIKNKHIPQAYKINSRDVRLKLLAGLVDSDGYINRNSIQITIKVKQLAEDIVFLAQSLGFHAEMKLCTKGIKSIGFQGEYYRIGISGDCSVVPTAIERKKVRCRSPWKDILVTGIREVRSVGEREYYGFTLDGNGRYVTADFTVTHNSLLVCLIELFRFFNFPRQKIVCGANSKDQVQFVHYDIMKSIVLQSPQLLSDVGRKGVQRQGLFFFDSHNASQSEIRTISSFSGIVSNINSYTFSEMFQQKKSDFFVQLDGSIRNIPNAMGCIDSTVSEKQHQLHRLYRTFIENKDPTLYFSYRYSKEGDPKDYWNPNMTQAQLDSYRAKFPFGEFERFFLNIWEAGGEKVFTAEVIEAMRYMGVDRAANVHQTLIDMIQAKNRFYQQKVDFEKMGIDVPVHSKILDIERRMWPVESVYKLKSDVNEPRMATRAELETLSDIYDTNWAIIGALDRGDPMKKKTSARTIVAAVAKGLIGSRTNPFIASDGEAPTYLYFVVHLVSVDDHSLEGIKNQFQAIHDEYGGLDMIGGERWGAWDLAPWCDERGIALDLWVGTYDRQKAMFSEFFTAAKFGRFKLPPAGVPGYRNDDIFEEEAEAFDHEPPVSGRKTGFFGSRDKAMKEGAQDDVMFTIGGAIYAGRILSVTDFRERRGKMDFGTFFPADGLMGDYWRR